MYQSFPLNKICRYAELFLCVGLAAVRLAHRFKAATPRRTTQLNEEKLCQLLANQTRAREKALQQTVTARPQQVAAAQVQHQTLSHVKTVVGVAQTFALLVPTHRASHVQRVRSSKSVLQRLMAHLRSALTEAVMAQLVQSALPMGKVATAGFQVMSVATLMTVRLVKIVADTRAVQSVLLILTAIHAPATVTAMTAAHVVETVRLMAAQVQQQVAATLAR
jgi:hypothetical protein